ncbi:hypothetical protein L596_015569 [Steinernema carpocapsae]|uniref:Uncharacterized protein n=1 Tax=Steinernema carpocapsae TaxID=34508 RepID=A0A4V6A353_STECR|nr:hypothetical protein L596_015569 [Steinernema carpocapsae]
MLFACLVLLLSSTGICLSRSVSGQWPVNDNPSGPQPIGVNNFESFGTDNSAYRKTQDELWSKLGTNHNDDQFKSGLNQLNPANNNNQNGQAVGNPWNTNTGGQQVQQPNQEGQQGANYGIFGNNNFGNSWNQPQSPVGNTGNGPVPIGQGTQVQNGVQNAQNTNSGT